MADDDRKNKKPLCCNPNEIATIVSCLCELKNTIECVLECTDDHSSGIKERIILCKLLDEVRQIEAKLDNPHFGLNEIKNEIIEINDVVSNSVFGLREVKNEIIDINNILTNQFFGLNEIKNEIIEINDLLNNATFGIPELKNEIRNIENGVALINNNVNNEFFGLNEIKNEIRNIENQTILLTNNVFGLNEIKNEVIDINNLLTNDVFGLNEIKSEIRGIDNDVRALNRTLTCENDSIRICGCEVGGSAVREILTDQNGILIGISQGSAYSQIGRLFSAAVFNQVTSSADSHVLLIENPPTSNRVLYLQRIFGGTLLEPPTLQFRYESGVGILLYLDATVDGASTPIPAVNLNAGFLDDSKMAVTLNTIPIASITGTLAGLFFQTNGLFALDFNGQIIIPPSHNLAIDVRNLAISSGDSLDIDLTAVWYELGT